MKRLILAFALATAIVAPSAFAGEPKLPADIGTWESYIRTCTPKPGTKLTITSYRKQTNETMRSFDVVDKEGERIAQLEFLHENKAGFKLIVKSNGSWVTHEFAFDEDGVTRFDKELEAALGISMVKYFSCIK